MNRTTVYKSVTDGRKTWKIIKKNDKYHFEGPRYECWNCDKIAFDHEDVAWLYSRYMFMKYNHQLDVYWDDECGEWHLTTSYGTIWHWT